MATATKSNKATDTDQMSDPFSAMETVDASALENLPRRGRAVSEDTKRIRETLETCLTEGTIRAIPCNEEQQADLTRKIRNAAKMSGKDEIKVTTRFDARNGKLYFGPAENFDKLSKK
jgi:hypothetical protein